MSSDDRRDDSPDAPPENSCLPHQISDSSRSRVFRGNLRELAVFTAFFAVIFGVIWNEGTWQMYISGEYATAASINVLSSRQGRSGRHRYVVYDVLVSFEDSRGATLTFRDQLSGGLGFYTKVQYLPSDPGRARLWNSFTTPFWDLMTVLLFVILLWVGLYLTYAVTVAAWSGAATMTRVAFQGSPDERRLLGMFTGGGSLFIATVYAVYIGYTYIIPGTIGSLFISILLSIPIFGLSALLVNAVARRHRRVFRSGVYHKKQCRRKPKKRR